MAILELMALARLVRVFAWFPENDQPSTRKVEVYFFISLPIDQLATQFLTISMRHSNL